MIKKKTIATLLPYKDNFTNQKAGSASIWIKDFNKKSLFKNQIAVCGFSENLNDLIDKKNYLNLKFNRNTFKSKNLAYVDKFININYKYKFDLVEVHNRPSYIHHLLKKNISIKLVLIFHNNPLNLGGSRTLEERNFLLNKCDKILFVSNWVKEKFFEEFDKKNHHKCDVIYPSISKLKKFPKKKKTYIFCRKVKSI